jgi:hypothetical protein
LGIILLVFDLGVCFDGLIWICSENPDSESEIPSMFQGAVLLRRGRGEGSSHGQNFNLEVDISGVVNRKSEG